jgi:hypothetical protein
MPIIKNNIFQYKIKDILVPTEDRNNEKRKRRLEVGFVFDNRNNHHCRDLLGKVFRQTDGHSYDGRRRTGPAGNIKSQNGQ